MLRSLARRRPVALAREMFSLRRPTGDWGRKKPIHGKEGGEAGKKNSKNYRQTHTDFFWVCISVERRERRNTLCEGVRSELLFFDTVADAN